MRKFHFLILCVCFTSCTASEKLTGVYSRTNASSFEQENSMNISMNIVQENENYLVIMNSGYGNTAHSATSKGEGLLTDSDMTIEFKKGVAKVYYNDNPEVVFTFSKSK